MVRIELLYVEGCPGHEPLLPRLRIDGADIEPGASDRRDYGLTCRLYPTAGGLAATPPDAWVLDALRAAARQG
jgi:hypothetical protein